MALQRQNLNINFSGGLDTKTDPWQVHPGKMLTLTNTIFTQGGLLGKRNGFARLPSLPDALATTATTYRGSLVATGTSLESFSGDSQVWNNKGTIQPLSLSVEALVRLNSSLTSIDVAIAPNGLSCVVYRDSVPNCYYQIIESDTGQVIVGQTALPATARLPRAFVLGTNFIITFTATVAAASHFQYLAIPIGTPSNPGSATDISTAVSGLDAGNDGYVANNNLYLSWDGNEGGGAIHIAYLDRALVLHSGSSITGKTATLLSVTADTSGNTPVIWFTWWASGSTNGFTRAYNFNLATALFASLQVITGVTVSTLVTSAYSASMRMFYGTSQNYSYTAVASNFISTRTVTQAGSAAGSSVLNRGVDCASKSFYFAPNGLHYLLVAYAGSYQPTFYLMDQSGNVMSKLAQSNGGGYTSINVLPSVYVSGSQVKIGYLFRDQIVPVNKTQASTTPGPVFAIKGANVATFDFGETQQIPVELGNDLHLTGGFLWMYDGTRPVEHGFHLYPEDLVATSITTTGSIHAQLYYYYALYAWTDAQGNIHRSAPSVGLAVDLTGAGTDTNKVTLNVPYLRQTYKTVSSNPVRIEIYRWSTGQPIPYMVTSITSPQANSVTSDSLAYVDTAADASILGNLVMYTEGGVLENIGAPACTTANIFKSRLILVTAEEPNLLWYSKPVIQGTPVEMTDLQTIYVAPATGAQGSTGPVLALGAMDDKEILFKRDAVLYFTGNGPDITGSSNDFSEPTFITGTVGCSNQQSVVLTPSGLIFQSDKGIWLLGRDLSTRYIGAPVEAYNNDVVLSALVIPGTNQVRFDLSSNVTLMYDYYYDQWGTFSGLKSISSTLYQSKHTFIDKFGHVSQESAGTYLDGSVPVLMSFTTAWFSLAGIQGFQRARGFFLLGKYLSSHTLTCQIAYDYDPSIIQNTSITPNNFNGTYGSGSYYGDGNPYGGVSPVEQWLVSLDRQKCQSFQLTIQENFDPSHGTTAGAGLTLSGINLQYSAKLGFARLPAAQSTG